MAEAEMAMISTALLQSRSPARAAVEAPRYDPRTRGLIEGPITATLVRLAAPNMLVMLAQTSVGLVETYFVGKLGTDPLAGVALVFPLLMLMQMMSAGAMGGGISSAIARALGGGRRDNADALALHALVIALVFGLTFTVALLTGGRWLYSAMGGSGASLDAALTYSAVVFSGAVLVWLFNSLANVIRGTGNMAVPALITVIGVVVLIPLSPCLIFGWGPLPRRRRGRGAHLLCYRQPGAGRLPALGKKRGAARLHRHSPPLGAALRYPARRCGRGPDHGADQSDRRHCHGPGRRVRAGGDRRLRHRRAARISADPAGVRAWRPVSRHGRHQYRRQAAGARLARRLDRRCDCREPHRADRSRRRRFSARLAVV